MRKNKKIRNQILQLPPSPSPSLLSRFSSLFLFLLLLPIGLHDRDLVFIAVQRDMIGIGIHHLDDRSDRTRDIIIGCAIMLLIILECWIIRSNPSFPSSRLLLLLLDNGEIQWIVDDGDGDSPVLKIRILNASRKSEIFFDFFLLIEGNENIEAIRDQRLPSNSRRGEGQGRGRGRDGGRRAVDDGIVLAIVLQ